MTEVVEDLCGAFPNIKVMIGDVSILRLGELFLSGNLEATTHHSSIDGD